MSKKILMINGSARKKNTYNILLQMAQLLKARGIESEILNIFDYTIRDCEGCDNICIRQGDCQINDDMPAIMQKILESDGLVLGSPVYLSGVTSRFKAFVDRTNAWFHKPEPAGKPVFFVVTTASTGIKETLHFLDQFATGFGGRKGGFVARQAKNANTPVAEKDLSRFLSLLEKDKKQYRPSMNEIVIFEVQKVLALKSEGDDRKFWQKKGWLDKLYYYDCRMNPAKKVFSKMMFKILSNAMK